MENRIILASCGIQTPLGFDLISQSLSKEDCEQGKILLITLMRRESKQELISACRALGFAEENITVFDETKPSLKEQDYDVIYVSEGNTFTLLDYMKKQGLFQLIRTWVKQGGRYIGISAGAHIAGKDIKAARSFDDNEVRLSDLAALALFEGAVIPHSDVAPFKRYQTYKKLSETGEYAYIAPIPTNDVLVMSDSFVEELRRRAADLRLKEFTEAVEKKMGWEKKQTFPVYLETGEITEAQVLSMVEIDGLEYLLYSIENNNGTCTILAAWIHWDEDGYCYFEDVCDQNDKELLKDYVQELLKKKKLF